MKKFLQEASNNNNNSNFNPDMTAFTSPPNTDDDSRVFTFVVVPAYSPKDKGTCQALFNRRGDFEDDGEANQE